MANQGTLSERDEALLRLLDHTPATTHLILKTSTTFAGEPFHDERRVRERFNARIDGTRAIVPATLGVGGPMNWYKLSPEGFRYLHGTEKATPHRSRFEAISPTRFHHTQTLAEIIVHVLVAAHTGRITVPHFVGDGELAIDGAGKSQRPDCLFRLTQSGRQFNVMFEVDHATEPLDSPAASAVREKIFVYEAHQDSVWQWWKRQRSHAARPYFRVVLLTTTTDRASHILWLAHQCVRNKDRHLCYAGSQEMFLGSADPLQSPLFNDHDGRWQSLVNQHPTAAFVRAPIRLTPPVTILG